MNKETSEKLLFPNFLDGPWFNGLLKERRRRQFRIGRCSPASGRVPQIPNSPQARSRRRSCYTVHCWYGSSACAPPLVIANLCWYYVQCTCADVQPRLIAKLDARYPTPAGLCRRANRSYQSKSYRPDVRK